MGARHHNVLAAQNQVHVSGAMNIFWAEVFLVVVSGIATDAEVIQKLAHLFCLALASIEIRRIKLDALVSELSNRAHGALEILLERVTNRIQLKPDGNGCGRAGLERPRKHR